MKTISALQMKERMLQKLQQPVTLSKIPYTHMEVGTVCMYKGKQSIITDKGDLLEDGSRCIEVCIFDFDSKIPSKSETRKWIINTIYEQENQHLKDFIIVGYISEYGE